MLTSCLSARRLPSTSSTMLQEIAVYTIVVGELGVEGAHQAVPLPRHDHASFEARP